MSRQSMKDMFNNVNKYTVPDKYQPAYNISNGYQVQTKLDTTLPADSNVVGFAPGVDDLGQILLNNKKGIKYNRNLVTEAGAQYWVQKKNLNARPGNEWSYANQDINGDGIPEIVIRDGKHNVRYINGYHLTKENRKLDNAYQQYIDSFGDPLQRTIGKALHNIGPGELSRNNFMYKNQKLDPANPDGPLEATGKLLEIGYQPRAPSAANLFLSYVVKGCYNEALIRANLDEKNAKIMKKIYGVIQANADIYKQYVTEPVNQFLKKRGYSEKQAKKKDKGQMSEYTKASLFMVQRIYNDENKKEEITEKIKYQMISVLNSVIQGNIGTRTAEIYSNPRVYGTPNFNALLGSYTMNVNENPQSTGASIIKPVNQMTEEERNQWQEKFANEVQTKEDFKKLRKNEQELYLALNPMLKRFLA